MADDWPHARAIAIVRAYLDGDAEGLNVLLADVIPPVRDADEDPVGAVLDEKRAKPVADVIRDLAALVGLFGAKLYGDQAGTSAALQQMLAGPDPT